MSTTAYAAYARELGLLLNDARRDVWDPISADVTAALDGRASVRLRELVPRQTRRDFGAFFTSGSVRDSFAALLAAPAPQRALVWWDPACGAGDLLLAAAEHLPLATTPGSTLANWSRVLHGTDLHGPFTEAARARLALAVLQRHRDRGDSTKLEADRAKRAFPAISVGDGLEALASAQKFQGHILLNPPFAPVKVDKDCLWSSGQTSSAAIFAAAAAQRLGSKSRITAILPDVLRSGSRYEAWRNLMQAHLRINTVEAIGRFDEHADVDVFLLAGKHATHSQPDAVAWWPRVDVTATIADHFDVRVGPVVDNRDPLDGPDCAFLTARDLPNQGRTGLPGRRRRFAGRLLPPPFVALRRTSRPGQGPGGATRGMGVMVTGNEPVALDNHLIALSPLDGSEELCMQLLDRLARPMVSAWLDERIRCRHLTVQVVRDLPW